MKQLTYDQYFKNHMMYQGLTHVNQINKDNATKILVTLIKDISKEFKNPSETQQIKIGYARRIIQWLLDDEYVFEEEVEEAIKTHNKRSWRIGKEYR